MSRLPEILGAVKPNLRKLGLALLTVIAALAVATPAITSAAETRVRAFESASAEHVRHPSDVSAVQHRGDTIVEVENASASRVAPQTTRAVVGAADDAPLHSPSFIAHPNGEIVAVPRGAMGPTPTATGKGFQFTGGSGGHGLDPRVTGIRIMDPVTTGKYPYPHGYVSYVNRSGQTVNPWTGRTVPRSDPWAHWPWSGME